MADTNGQPPAEPAAAQQEQQEQQLPRMMLLQVNEEDWAIVMLDEKTGSVRELQVDAATAKQVQDGTLTPTQLAALLAAQEQGGGDAGGGKAS